MSILAQMADLISLADREHFRIKRWKLPALTICRLEIEIGQRILVDDYICMAMGVQLVRQEQF